MTFHPFDSSRDILTGAALFLDFDGTLVEIAETPDAVTTPPGLPGQLNALSNEIAGNAAGVTYDNAEYTVVVTVTDNLEGALEAAVTYEGLAEGETVPTFVNTYKGKAVSVEIEASKKLTGKTLTADAYSFTLTNKDNDKDVHTVKNDAEGNVVFKLDLTEVGTYTYIVINDIESASYINITFNN